MEFRNIANAVLFKRKNGPDPSEVALKDAITAHRTSLRNLEAAIKELIEDNRRKDNQLQAVKLQKLRR